VKDIEWIGSSKEDLLELRETVRNEVGHALYLVQIGRKPDNAIPMKGFGGASVLEIREELDTNTFRVIYTVRFEEAIYVLHSFQKKSTIGIKTPQRDLNIIDQRLKIAEELHRKWLLEQEPTLAKRLRKPKNHRK
jgi:phage-related protein